METGGSDVSNEELNKNHLCWDDKHVRSISVKIFDLMNSEEFRNKLLCKLSSLPIDQFVIKNSPMRVLISGCPVLIYEPVFEVICNLEYMVGAIDSDKFSKKELCANVNQLKNGVRKTKDVDEFVNDIRAFTFSYINEMETFLYNALVLGTESPIKLKDCLSKHEIVDDPTIELRMNRFYEAKAFVLKVEPPSENYHEWYLSKLF